MSYILDALRRADAERERGGVPGLHAQPQRGEAAGNDQGRAGLPWAGIAIALALALGVVLAWLLLGHDPAPEPPPASPAAVAPPPPVPAVPAPPAAPPPAAAALPPALAAALPPQQPALPPPTPVPVARPAAARHEPAPPAKAAANTPAAPAPAAPVPPPEARVPLLRELPEELRRQIPALAVGGSTWSENAASRFVILNGQLLRENDALTPELTLRLIRQRSAILEFRGQRFELGF